MAFGLECYDAAGNSVLKVTDRLTRYGGFFDTGTAGGSATIPMFATGTPWINVRDIDPFQQTTNPSAVSVSGNTVQWSFPASSTYGGRSVRVFYGVY